MSVASEIERLQQAKVAIETAIEGKGVTVPSDATYDDFANLIGSIQQGSTPVLQSKSVSPTTSQQTVIPDSGYDGLSSVSVGAIETETKNITPSTSQQTVDPTTGKFISQVVVSAIQTETKSATPSASQQNITPSSGKFLTQVTVDAVPTEAKTATPSTSQQEITPSSGKFLSKVTVSAIQTETKSATPSTQQQEITPSSGKFLTKVTVGAVTSAIDANISAGNIKQGVSILGVVGTYSGGGSTLVPTAGDYPVVENAGMKRIAATALTSTGISITIPVAGTYRLKWTAFRSSTSGTNSSQLYRNRGGTTSAIGTEITAWTETYYQANTLDISCEKDDVIIVYARSRNTSNYVCAGNLSACVAQKLWTN